MKSVLKQRIYITHISFFISGLIFLGAIIRQGVIIKQYNECKDLIYIDDDLLPDNSLIHSVLTTNSHQNCIVDFSGGSNLTTFILNGIIAPIFSFIHMIMFFINCGRLREFANGNGDVKFMPKDYISKETAEENRKTESVELRWLPKYNPE